MTIKQDTAIKFQHKDKQSMENTFITLLDHTKYAIPAEIYTTEEIAW